MGEDNSPPCLCLAASWADEATCVCIRSQAAGFIQLHTVPRTAEHGTDSHSSRTAHRGEPGRAQGGGLLPLLSVFAAGVLLGCGAGTLGPVRRVLERAPAVHKKKDAQLAEPATGDTARPRAVDGLAVSNPWVVDATPVLRAISAPAGGVAAALDVSEGGTPRANHTPRASTTGSPLDEATQQRILDDADRALALPRAAERSARERAAYAATEQSSRRNNAPATPATAQRAGQTQPGGPWKPWEPDAWESVDLTGVAFTPRRTQAAGMPPGMTPRRL